MKHEARAQIEFGKYLREAKPFGYYELKHTDKEYFAFSKIEQVQYDGLQATEKHGFIWKLSDQDQRPKPCDSICTPPLPSYLVISFNKAFFFIRIKEIVDMKEAGKIAISQAEAMNIAEKIVQY